MNGRLRGSVIGAVFGLIYVIVNSGSFAPEASIPLRALGAVAFVAVLIAVARSGDREERLAGAGFGRGYWLVVAAEVAALAAGLALLNGPLDDPQAGVAWVSFVVGAHFVALARVFREPLFLTLGAAITVCGLAGLALAAAGAGQAPVASVSGIVPGALLLAAGWSGTRGQQEDAGRSGARGQLEEAGQSGRPTSCSAA